MKTKLFIIVNSLLLLSMLTQIITGIAMKQFHVAWGRPIHMNNAMILNILFISHIILNWGWIKTNLLRIK